MRTGLVPNQRMIEPECRSDPAAAPVRDGSRDVREAVLAGLREMLELALSGELELSLSGDASLAVVIARDSMRLSLVVAEIADPAHGLSPRELQIARLVANGATNQVIARALDISTWTVSTHLRRIFAKLDVCTRAEMVAQLFATSHLLSGG
jgi:DNA-binding CsgD family transcriptional regulator